MRYFHFLSMTLSALASAADVLTLPQALLDVTQHQTLPSAFVRYCQLSQHFHTSLGDVRNTF